jgi:hypothetical protein
MKGGTSNLTGDIEGCKLFLRWESSILTLFAIILDLKVAKLAQIPVSPNVDVL